MFDPKPDAPWVTKDGKLFLLYDYVHLMKCIRNNWLTEKCGEILFETESGSAMIARWSDLRDLFKAEESQLVKMSKLNETAVYPKPIERQRVSTCLNVFCDETVVALKTHPELLDKNNSGTINFIKMLVNFWKIVNVRGLNADRRFKDECRAVISSEDDPRLTTLTSLADTVLKMKGVHGKRKQQLTADTCMSFVHTCHGIVALTKYLLNTTHTFVMIGEFSSDFLEKYYGKLRMGSGGIFYHCSTSYRKDHYMEDKITSQTKSATSRNGCWKWSCMHLVQI